MLDLTMLILGCLAIYILTLSIIYPLTTSGVINIYILSFWGSALFGVTVDDDMNQIKKNLEGYCIYV